ncbi:dihydrofolate reductase-like domain-containing protein [Aspergillus keveii]|uniref:2,5-diamino-6-ribosylamino-4(3H)-pyrimidinone 5'-phosphate reductase n=1 Tax=Aspergillus keveii TaxID=714993 RepID=A0ABR4GBW4_9EURO
MDHDASGVSEGSSRSNSPNSRPESLQDGDSTRVVEVTSAQPPQIMDTAPDIGITASIAQQPIEHQAQTQQPQQDTGTLDGDTSASGPTSPAHAENRSASRNGFPEGPANETGSGGSNLAAQTGGPADYDLIDNPPNLARIRQVLFECREPIEISLQEFETYWPFIDNVWVKQRSNSSKEGHCTTDYYMCRLRRPTHRSSDSRPLPEGKRPRKKRVREGGLCNFQIKVVRFEGAYSTVTISRTPGSSHEHAHDLDYIDKVKRNSGLMEFARREASKGYLPSSIYTKFREEPGKLIEAGGKFCTVTDIRNVSAKWRLQNPEVKLVPHEGYEYQKGHGIVRTRPEGDNSDSTAPKLPPVPPDTLPFPQFPLDFLEPYLPRKNERREFPHVTLSYASSMDSKISLLPGMQTVLSGPEAKLMTHYLRSRHDAILIGVGTVLADNPGLNCRLQGAGGYGGLGRMWQPRPVVVDPLGRWPVHPDCRMLRTAVEGKGRAPWVVVSPGAQIHPQTLMMLKGYGGDYLRIMEYHQNWRLRWEPILRALASEGIKSVMIEGGGRVLSELLNPEYTEFIDSIIVTIAPTYLGSGGVGVSPDSKRDAQGKPNAALNPRDVKWVPMGQNVIMCGKIRTAPPPPEVTPPLAEPSAGLSLD